MNSLRYRAWMSNAAYYPGLLLLVTLPIRQDDWLQWLPLVFVVYLMGTLVLSVGYHRLFCHGSFETSRFWHAVFSFSGVMFWYGSPLQWSVFHAAHHKHSDTSLDPHKDGWQAIASKGYRSTEIVKWKTRRLLKKHGSLHKFVEFNYVLILLFGLILLTAISPAFVLNAYLPAVGLVLLSGGLHTVFSHGKTGPRNIWWMEFIIPAGGDWLHGTHHEKPGLSNLRTKWYHFDPGGMLIGLIKTKTA